MNRIEFMAELEKLLQNVPEEEKTEAMQFYNDYFDDAGQENEAQVIDELESPAKIAAMIKAGLGEQDEETGEYTETGYTDSRFEEKDTPAPRDSKSYEYQKQQESQSYQYQGDTAYDSEKKPPRTNRTLKIILIIAILIAAAPIAIPVVFTVAALVIACVAALFGVFVAIVLTAAAVTMTGLWLTGIGLVSLIPELAAGLALIGAGLIVSVLGVIGTVVGVKLCIVVFPGICRGIVWVCRWPFRRKAVV